MNGVDIKCQAMSSAGSLETLTDREAGGQKQRAAKRKRRREAEVGSSPVISALLRARMDCRAGEKRSCSGRGLQTTIHRLYLLLR